MADQRQIEYLAAMLAAMDGMVLRMALAMESHNLQGMLELIMNWSEIKGEINREFGEVFIGDKGNKQ